jgi:hypothetical protein
MKILFAFLTSIFPLVESTSLSARLRRFNVPWQLLEDGSRRLIQSLVLRAWFDVVGGC